MKKRPHFIPALHFHELTRWYDPMMRRLFPETGIKAAMIAQARIQPGQAVLDAGCGTGTLALLIKRAHPDAAVSGLDIDFRILAIARGKARQQGDFIDWQQGSAACLPYADGSFDRVFASLLLHHLTRDDKRQMLREAFRVLKPGGELYTADFGKPQGLGMWLISLAARWFEEVYDHVLGRIPDFIASAGFDPVQAVAHYRTLAGTMTVYRACKLGGQPPARRNN